MRRFVVVLPVCLMLAACQSQPTPSPAPAGKSAALLTMERVATAAHRCWFASKDPAFRDYSFANELNSFTGRPRFLLVPRGNYGGRPLLVVQAEGPSGRLDVFGPMLDGPTGPRVRADLTRFRSGDASCGSAA